MWFGTFSGLNRYDGREIRNYKPEPGKSRSLSSPVIFELYEDSRNRLWVGTDGGGLNLYNPKTDDFTLYRHDELDKNSLSSNNVYALSEDRQGNLWVGTGGGGLNLFNERSGSFSVFRSSDEPGSLQSDVIRVLYKDRNGSLWVGTEGGGFALWDEIDGFRTFQPTHSNTVRSIFEDSSGRFWIGTEKGGLYLFDRQRESFKLITYPFSRLGSDYSVRSISEGTDGNLWIGTEGKGIFIIGKKGEPLNTIRHDRNRTGSLSKDKIRHLFLDRNGLMWIGTRDGGVNRYNPGIEGFKRREYRDVRAVYEDSEENVWVGTDGSGLEKINKEGLVLERFDQSLSSNQVYSILEDNLGYIWIGTDGGGINRLDPFTGEIEVFLSDAASSSSLSSNTVWAILEDSRSNLWIGTEGGGLNLYNPRSRDFTRFTSVPDDSATLNGNSVRIIYEDSLENLWIGTWDGGLNLFDRKEGKFKRYTREPARASSLSDSSVNCIFEDSKNRLWIGTAAGGLNLMNRKLETFTHYRAEEGMLGNNILGVQEDRLGYLWISTDRGLSKFHPDTGEIVNFGTADGLAGSVFSINASVVLQSTDEMIFGGAEGLTRFQPGDIYVNNAVPPVVITGLSVMNEPVLLEKDDEELVLSYDDDFLNISFAVLDYTAPERNRYSVIMEGLQDKWTDLGNRNSIVYNSLPTGHYLFKVKGADNNGIWNESGAQLRIRILPPWWETRAFSMALILSMGALIFLFIRLRLRRLHEKNKELREYSIHIQDVREEERTWVAREVHDQLGQTLTVLKMEIFRARSENKEPMLELVNSTLETVKDLSTRLRPKVLDNLCIGEAIAWLVRDFSSHTGVEVTEDLDEMLSIDNKEVKTALFRICQELLTNVIRHSGASSAKVYMRSDSLSVELKVSDNGRGYIEDQLSKKRSFGIRGIKERCRHLGGIFKMEVTDSGGTAVSVIIPLEKI